MSKKRKKKKTNTLKKAGLPSPGTGVSQIPAEPAEPQELNDSSIDRPRKKRIVLFTALGLVILAGLYLAVRSLAPGGGEADLKNLNVILITIDTLRADYVGVYKEGNADTPTLDALAREGVMFERCIAQTPLTLPSHTSILSGTYPLFHRVRDNGGFQVPEKLELVSEIVQNNGFLTAAFIGAFVLHSKWGINQGFNTYSDQFDATIYKKILLENDRPAAAVLDDASQWITKNKDKPFFAWIHLYDPHSPYRPPSPYAGKHPGNPYRDEVEYTDQEIGRFITFLKENGLYRRCLLIVASDHGESLGQHGEEEHGLTLYEPAVWVPLIIRAPVSFPVKRVEPTVELVDIAPTILHMLDIPIPPSYQGESLVNLVYGKNRRKKKTAYSETYYPRLHFGWSELKAFYWKEKKYILAPREELFNITDDIGEKQNLALTDTRGPRDLKKRLWDFQVRESKNALSPGAIKNLSKKDRDRLQSLGYVTGTAAVDTASGADLPDPKIKMGVFKEFKESERLVNSGRYNEAIPRLTRVLESDPGIIDAHVLLGQCYKNTGKYPEALNSFQRVLELKPDFNFVIIELLGTFTAKKDYEKAEEEALAFLKRFPDDYLLHEILGRIYFLQQDFESALKSYNRSVELEPDNAAVLSGIGNIYLLRNDHRTARPYIERALKINPRKKEGYYLLALIEEAGGNLEKAVEYYKKEMEYNPGDFRVSYNLAENLRKMGAYEKAIPYYRKTIEWRPMFKMPYFLVANYLLEKKENLAEAVELCKTGIAIQPEDRYTLFGYYIITNIYAYMGDTANRDYYTGEGERLNNKLQKDSG